MSTPGQRLREARVSAGITAEELASKVGRSTSAIRNQENGTNGIPSDLAREYAMALGVEPAWILYGDGVGDPEVHAPAGAAGRLKQARIEAGFDSARKAAAAKGLHPQNLSDHEAGRRQMAARHAAAYGLAFGVSPEWILFGGECGLPQRPAVALTALGDGAARLEVNITLPFPLALQILTLIEGNKP